MSTSSHINLRIGNMVCLRCIMVVRELASRLGPEVVEIDLGYVSLASLPSEEELAGFSSRLNHYGFSLIRDDESQLVEDTRLAVRGVLTNLPLQPGFRLRAAVASRLEAPYASSSATFRAATGESIQAYFNRIRMVKACELLREANLQVSEVGYRLGYSNLSGFSRAFEREIGSRPSVFKLSDAPRPLLGGTDYR